MASRLHSMHSQQQTWRRANARFVPDSFWNTAATSWYPSVSLHTPRWVSPFRKASCLQLTNSSARSDSDPCSARGSQRFVERRPWHDAAGHAHLGCRASDASFCSHSLPLKPIFGGFRLRRLTTLLAISTNTRRKAQSITTGVRSPVLGRQIAEFNWSPSFLRFLTLQ